MRALPSFHALRAFEAAARLGSLARAAQELGLTPSAISHQLRALEAHFGRKLLAPGPRAKTLTDDGARLAAGLAHAFDALETACAEVTPRTTAATLTLHCAPSFAAKWLAPRLERFIRQHPGITIRLASGTGSHDLLRDPETDAAIVYGPPPPGPGLTVDPLGEEQVTALCTPALAASHGLRTVPLIESTLSPIRWSDWFAANGLARPPQAPAAGFDRGALAVSAAVQGLGATLETERFTEAERAAGQLVPLGPYQPVARTLHHLVTRAGPLPPPRVRTFRTWLLDAAGVTPPRTDRPPTGTVR